MLKYMFVLVVFLGLMMTVLPTGLVVADEGCVIPESGPWPPCATGGESAQPSANTDTCVIPESGPWPPCATGGDSAAPATPDSSDDACMIPESGPWPPCATGSGHVPVPTATPTPEPSPTPEPAHGSATHPRFGRIVNVEVVSKEPNDVVLQVEVVGIREDSWPGFVFFDPDTCLELCDRPHELQVYKIKGTGWLPEGETSGVFSVTIHADRLICPYQPETKRLVVAVSDINETGDAIVNGRTVVYEIMHQFPMEHRWCQ